jgi:hypothetical protein
MTSLDFVVYGPKAHSRTVGGLLSDSRIYLQHPTLYKSELVEYDNPHVLKFDLVSPGEDITSTSPEDRSEPLSEDPQEALSFSWSKPEAENNQSRV